MKISRLRIPAFSISFFEKDFSSTGAVVWGSSLMGVEIERCLSMLSLVSARWGWMIAVDMLLREEPEWTEITKNELY